MNGKSYFLMIFIMFGSLASYATARVLRKASQEVLHPYYPTARSTDAYARFVHSCLFEDESSNKTDPKADDTDRKTATMKGNRNAYAFDINTCLFNGWRPGVLSSSVQCNSGTELCYSVNPPTAQFAVCYDTLKLIPIFTGHVLRFSALLGGVARASNPPWKENKNTKGALYPSPQALVKDYDPTHQVTSYRGWDTNKNYFCSRGHLTPKGDFKTAAERDLTFVITNAAPQWQKFNNQNWAGVENAVREYSRSTSSDLYIFTGTGGEQLYGSTAVKLKGRVTAPKYYWKTVCDPAARESILFVAENNVNVMTTTRITGCNGISQTSENGVVQCYALDAAKSNPDFQDFQLPPLDKKNCNPAKKGTFMDHVIRSFLNK